MNKDARSRSNSPFWVDTPTIQEPISTNSKRWSSLPLISVLVLIIIIVTPIGIASVETNFSPLILVGCGVYFLFVTMIGILPEFLVQRKRKAEGLKAMDIQENAKHRSGASTMGSAIHVAGHPALERDQAIVLALTEDKLEFYEYDESKPLDSLPLGDILTVKTVVYDDERVPHGEVVDSAAQAVQIEFELNGQAWTTLFRAMKQIRPIDWYHAIQQARSRQQAGA